MVFSYMFPFILIIFFKEIKPHSITKLRDQGSDIVAIPNNHFVNDFFSQASTQWEAQVLLTHSHTRMMTYIDENAFDSNAFARSAQELHGLILEADTAVQSISPSNSTIVQQLKYVKLIYRTLMEAADLLGYFKQRHPAQHLLRCTVHVNLHLLTMHDTYGSPSIPKVEFEQVRSCLTRELKSWRSEFKKTSTGVPGTLRASFRGQYNRAVRTLQSMARHFSY